MTLDHQNNNPPSSTQTANTLLDNYFEMQQSLDGRTSSRERKKQLRNQLWHLIIDLVALSKKNEHLNQVVEEYFLRILEIFPFTLYQSDISHQGKIFLKTEGIGEKFDIEEITASRASLIHHEDRQTWLRNLAETLDNPNLFTFETTYRLRDKAGDFHTIEDKICIERDADGKAQNITGLLHDITKDVAVKLELAKQQKSYSEILERIPGIVYSYTIQEHQHSPFEIINKSSTLDTAFNHSFLSTLEKKGLPNALFTEDLEHYNSEIISDASDHCWQNVEYRVKCDCGRIVHALDFGQMKVDDNGVQHIEGIIFNITERQRNKERARRFEKLIREADEALFIIDPATAEILDVNDATTKLLGYSRQEVIGSKIPDIDRGIATLEDWQQLSSRIKQNISVQFEVNLQAEDDSTVFGEVNATYVKDSEGDLFIALVRDISKTKLLESRYRLQREESHGILLNTIGAIAQAMEKRDPYTAGHQERVAHLATAIGRQMGLTSHELEGITLGGKIHDIGKIYIPAEILVRPGKITELEFGILKTHPDVGYEIVEAVQFPWPIKDMILQHHERIDGSGYPRGLTGDEICLEAKIIAVADVVEAIASHRPYRPSRGISFALREIEEHMGSHYDSAVAQACLDLFRKEGYELIGPGGKSLLEISKDEVQ